MKLVSDQDAFVKDSIANTHLNAENSKRQKTAHIKVTPDILCVLLPGEGDYAQDSRETSNCSQVSVRGTTTKI